MRTLVWMFLMFLCAVDECSLPKSLDVDLICFTFSSCTCMRLSMFLSQENFSYNHAMLWNTMTVISDFSKSTVLYVCMIVICCLHPYRIISAVKCVRRLIISDSRSSCTEGCSIYHSVMNIRMLQLCIDEMRDVKLERCFSWRSCRLALLLYTWLLI